jgi:DNA polymerase III subunit alpha
VPPQFNEETFLRYLCDKGLEWRFGSRKDDPVLRQRLDRELDIIADMGFNTYFLIVWDLCEFARAKDIWWNVRGSGAGSLAAYCLGITSVDPIQNNLLFERFLNPGRVSMPDIDLDYPDDRRGEMIEYAARKYGDDKVAAIITFGTMGAKAAVKDVARVYDIDLVRVNEMVSHIPQEAKQKPIPTYISTSNPDLKKIYDNDAEMRKVLDEAAALQGVARHTSVHAAGVIVSDKPLVEYLPLHRVTGKDNSNGALKAVTQFPMETAESIGLLKVDFLGLSTLTILRRACDLIRQNHDIHYTMDNIPYRHDDPRHTDEQRHMLDGAFALMGRGETVGVFQLESTGMQQMLKGMRPKIFENIVAAVSLYRPGPMEFIPTYNRRLHDEEPSEYRHPLLEPILGETFGICITGDSVLFEAVTGKKYRVDALADFDGEFYIQGVDECLQPSVSRVTDWVNNGVKDVYRLTLRNGTSIKATADHKFLTEAGWVELAALNVGDHIATPKQLLPPRQPLEFDRRKLRVLAYLIADGSLASGTSVDFVNKDPVLIDEYLRCLEAFEDILPVFVKQIRDVTRVGIRSKRSGRATTSLLTWMRELGLKYPPDRRMHPVGVRSHEKSVPNFVFQLNNDDLAYFVASLWDCDGHISSKLCHYRTISKQLAIDVQTLLLRLGFNATIHAQHYENSSRDDQTAYQISVFDTARFATLMHEHMASSKREAVCTQRAHGTTINRVTFIEELKSTTGLSGRALMSQYGIDRQHLYSKAQARRQRVSEAIVQDVARAVPLPHTLNLLNVDWEAIVSIEHAGQEAVYDLTVDGTHNFVANNVIVHNCVYQEQIMQIAGELFGYELGEADLMRRAVSKKKEKDLKKHRDIFLERGPQNGIDEEAAGKIFDDIEFFANYGFNKSHATDYAVITVQTAFLKTHYPEEYMAALLSVHRDDSTKIATFLAECRRLNIPILPPDVNHSAMDFSIQPQEDGRRGIRFGLEAIKNAGAGAVQPIIEARREGGLFTSLEDFCHRVDLRHVGKRTLESLVKVGALHSIHENRNQLLQSVDRLVSYSGSYHRDQEVGQMNMFGAMGGEQSALGELLPVPEVRPRELLGWEKELLGLYVTGRPIDKFVKDLQRTATLDIATLIDPDNAPGWKDRNVAIAGEIVELRKVFTKKGEAMGILKIEDWHPSAATIEVVFFPRNWSRLQAQVETGDIPEIRDGEVFMIGGKFDFDSERERIQVLGETMTQSFELMIGSEEHHHPNAAPFWADDTTAGDDGFMEEDPGRIPASEWSPVAEPEPAPQAALPINGSTSDGAANGNGHHLSSDDDDKGDSISSADEGAARWQETHEDGSPVEWHELEEVLFAEDEIKPRLLTVVMPRSGDDEKDGRFLKRLHNMIIECPGRDRFAVLVDVDGQIYRMDFPQTTGINDRLLGQLAGLVGEDAVQVHEDFSEPAGD